MKIGTLGTIFRTLIGFWKTYGKSTSSVFLQPRCHVAASALEVNKASVKGTVMRVSGDKARSRTYFLITFPINSCNNHSFRVQISH